MRHGFGGSRRDQFARVRVAAFGTVAAVVLMVSFGLWVTPAAAGVPPVSDPLTVGVTGVGAQIGAPGEEDDYHFSALSGVHYVAEVLNVASGLGQTRLEVLDSSGQNVGGDSYCDNGSGNVCDRVEFDVSISSTYYLTVTGDDGAATGTYRVRVLPDFAHGLVQDSSGEPDDVPSLAEPISVGLDGALSRSIYLRGTSYYTVGGDVDTFRFAATAGVTYTAEVYDVATGLGDTRLTVTDSSGQNLGGDSYCDNGTGNVCDRVGFAVSIAGTYYLTVQGDDPNASGTYAVRVLPDYNHGGSWAYGEDNDTPDLAYPIALAAAQTHTIYALNSRYVTPAGDVDYYRFTGRAGHRYVADVLDVAAALYPTSLVVTDAAGHELGSDNYCENGTGSVCDQVAFDVSISGTYFLAVAADDGNASGSYTMCVYDAAAPSCRASSQAVADFDGNGRTDISVWRPSTGAWYVRGLSTVTYGVAGDTPVPADYNGDGRTDNAVWRPSTGAWYVRGLSTVTYGVAGDRPVPGDYNGDGRTDIAVWRPSTGAWYVRGLPTVTYGGSGDIPVPGDYNGDGRTDIAVFRPSTGVWYIRGVGHYSWGGSSDKLVPGDYNGDGRTDIAIWRPANHTWYIRGLETVSWGAAGDVAEPGDYNGDHRTDLAIWRPATGGWYIRGSSAVTWGVRGDTPLPGLVHR